MTIHGEMKNLVKRLQAENSIDPSQTPSHLWIRAVHQLYRDLEKWIEPLVDARVAAYTGRLEQKTGGSPPGRMRIERPAFTILIKKTKFVFRPSSIGHLDLQVLGHQDPKLFQVALAENGSWLIGFTAGELQVPLTEESLAKFLSRWV
jgi:hypothetical protein